MENTYNKALELVREIPEKVSTINYVANGVGNTKRIMIEYLNINRRVVIEYIEEKYFQISIFQGQEDVWGSTVNCLRYNNKGLFTASLERFLERLSYFEHQPKEFEKEVITFDYDGCFDRHKQVRDAVVEAKLLGYKTFILTYRFDELNKFRYPKNPTNDDLYKKIKGYFTDREVIFMNSELKGKHLAYLQNVIIHVDDSWEEHESLRRYAPHVEKVWCSHIGELHKLKSTLGNMTQTESLRSIF